MSANNIEELFRKYPERYWPTTELWCNGPIIYFSKLYPYMIYSRGIVTFIYEKSDQLRDALQRYKDNESLPCRDLLDILKRLRADLALCKSLGGKF